MKNDSWLFPFEMLGDSYFDSNHDEKLTGWETIMRDSFLLEEERRWNERKKKNQTTTQINYNRPHSNTANMNGVSGIPRRMKTNMVWTSTILKPRMITRQPWTQNSRNSLKHNGRL